MDIGSLIAGKSPTHETKPDDVSVPPPSSDNNTSTTKVHSKHDEGGIGSVDLLLLNDANSNSPDFSSPKLEPAAEAATDVGASSSTGSRVIPMEIPETHAASVPEHEAKKAGYIFVNYFPQVDQIFPESGGEQRADFPCS